MTKRLFTIGQADVGKRLDRFLAKALPGIDQGAIHVRIREKHASPRRMLWGGEKIEVELPEPKPVHAAAGMPEVPILYQDAELIVVDKPAGLVVETEGKGRSIVELVGASLGGCEVGGFAAPGVAHRLDRETTGCLVLARTDDALAKLKAAFVAKQVDKRYLALVLGDPPDKAHLEGPYNRDPKDPRRYTTRYPSARRASLTFEVRERLAGAALLEVNLETGRTHQIRVQLAEAGYPVLGDTIYGPDAVRQHPAAKLVGRHALHAFLLRIASTTLKGVVVEAPLPADMGKALESLRIP